MSLLPGGFATLLAIAVSNASSSAASLSWKNRCGPVRILSDELLLLTEFVPSCDSANAPPAHAAGRCSTANHTFTDRSACGSRSGRCPAPAEAPFRVDTDDDEAAKDNDN